MIFFWAIFWEILDWLWRLGGFGLILMGLVDSSVIPTPGGLDALTIVFAANRPDSWLYYAAMAVVGSVLGGYLTYRLGRKGGEEALEERLSKKRFDKVRRTFEKWGFMTVFVPAILPPPVPISPFLLGAGALNYPVKKFVVALTLGRAIRFTLVAYFASRFGRRILKLIADNYTTVLIVFIALLVLGATAGVVYYVRRKRARNAPQTSPTGD